MIITDVDHTSAKNCFYLNDQHVNHTWVSDVLVLVEHLPHFVSSLTCCDIQLECRHCRKKEIQMKTQPNVHSSNFIQETNFSTIIIQIMFSLKGNAGRNLYINYRHQRP